MKQVLELPFENYGYGGIIETVCEENPGPEISGFSLLKDAVDFDVGLCRGYPMFQMRVREYSGPRYGKLTGVIQIITGRRYRSAADKTGDVDCEVDQSAKEREMGYPFFAFGYPVESFDAPCRNLKGADRLNWTADTFLVTYPSRMNDEEIRFLAGVRWGYDEDEAGCSRMYPRIHPWIHPLAPLNGSDWNGNLSLLQRDFPGWNYVNAE